MSLTPRVRKAVKFYLPLAFLLTVVGLRVNDPAWLSDFRIRGTEWLQRLQPREFVETPVMIVDVDDATLERFGQWPWPRTQMAELIAKLTDMGAAVIALDVIFAEPDRTSATQWREIMRGRLDRPGLSELLNDLPDHDALFAEEIAASRVVTGFALKNAANDVRPALKAGFAFGGDDPMQFVPQLAGAVNNLSVLENAAAGNGHFNMLAENDGIIRRVPLLIRVEDTLYPSLVLESLRVAQGAGSYKIKSSGASGAYSFGEATGVTQIRVGQFTIPTDGRGRLWLYDSGYQKQRWLSAWRVLAGEADPQTVAGKIVYIGTSASGLKDLRATPLNPVAAGVEVHAQLTEQIISGQFLYRPDWANGAELIYLVFFGLLLILLLPRVSGLWCALLAFAGIGAAFMASWYAFKYQQMLLDAWVPSLAVFAIYLPTSLMHYVFSESDRKQIRTAFSRYLSPQLVKQLADNPNRLKLGGESKEMTVLFADIRGFTTLSESLDAQGVTRLINRFMTPMTHIILEHGGTIDKYMGDGLMAFWNAPLTVENHAAQACQAALEMREHLKTLNRELESEGSAPIGMGIGLNTGECCVGNLGSDLRFDYSVVGDAVNLGSRLEGQSKTYGVDIVVGETTYLQASEYAALELDFIRVKGKSKPVRIYGLVGDSQIALTDEFQQLRELHEALMEAYRNQQWEQAATASERCLDKSNSFGLKGLYQLYIERIEAFRQMPPSENWDGVYVATTK